MSARWWRRVREPSLMRRLLLAQMLLLTVLWTMSILFLVMESSRDTAVLEKIPQFDAILAAADGLASNPARRQAVLHAIDAAIRAADNVNGDPHFTPTFRLDQAGRLIYQSAGTPPGVQPVQLDRIETLTVDGVRWHARARQSAESGARVTIILPADSFGLLVTLNSHGFYLLPLLISLPFLALPAWLSIRQALRPWRRVAGEIAARGPQDLRPLDFRPPHQELAAMTENINALMQRVSDSAARERAFIADAAHELRTPLAAMRINVEALQRQAADPRQQELLDGILRSASRAGRLVGQLLMLMRSDVPEAQAAHAVHLDAMLQDRMAELSGIALAAGVELELKADQAVQVVGRQDSLVSLIDNLVENAIKYSPQGATVSVCLEAKGKHALLSVRDHGRGIAPALRERVFDRFYRDPDQTESGSGLGLAIVKSVVLQHGGEIRLRDPAEGRGLLVEVSLPRA
jgi:two-component system sensor histidine kinase QseC